MRPLDIPPHSPAASRLAVTSLALIAGFALAAGYLRQVVAVAPQQHQAVAAGTDTIAEATPAPEPILQVAEPPPRRVHVAEPVDLSDDIAPPAVPAADAAATAPDPAAPVQPADPPTKSDGPPF